MNDTTLNAVELLKWGAVARTAPNAERRLYTLSLESLVAQQQVFGSL